MTGPYSFAKRLLPYALMDYKWNACCCGLKPTIVWHYNFFTLLVLVRLLRCLTTFMVLCRFFLITPKPCLQILLLLASDFSRLFKTMLVLTCICVCIHPWSGWADITKEVDHVPDGVTPVSSVRCDPTRDFHSVLRHYYPGPHLYSLEQRSICAESQTLYLTLPKRFVLAKVFLPNFP